MPLKTNAGGEYLYLGAPALFGLLWLAGHGNVLRAQIPILAIGVVSFIVLNNPFGLVWLVIQHSDLLSQVCRSWYFLAGITLSVAGLTAAGLDHFLRRESRRAPGWFAPLALCLLGLWSGWQLWIWLAGGSGVASGWRGAIDPP